MGETIAEIKKIIKLKEGELKNYEYTPNTFRDTIQHIKGEIKAYKHALEICQKWLEYEMEEFFKELEEGII